MSCTRTGSLGASGARDREAAHVLHLWGTDLEPRAPRAPFPRAPTPAARVGSSSRGSQFLADGGRELGARSVRVIPNGVDVPAGVSPPEEPPHVLYAGRLSEEKGILELLDAAGGLPLVVVGDGPASRPRVEDAGRLRCAREPRCLLRGGRRRLRSLAARGPTASSRARRWPTAVQSSPPRPAVSATRSRTTSPGSSWPARRSAGAARRARAASRRQRTPGPTRRAARARAEESYSWAVATESLPLRVRRGIASTT